MTIYEALEEAARDARAMRMGLGFTRQLNQVRDLWTCPDPDCPWVLRTFQPKTPNEDHFIEQCVIAHEAAIHGLASD